MMQEASSQSKNAATEAISPHSASRPSAFMYRLSRGTVSNTLPSSKLQEPRWLLRRSNLESCAAGVANPKWFVQVAFRVLRTGELKSGDE